MSAAGPPAFGSLYYTDCLPGQGLDGGAGFQFQARSSGVGDDARRAAARGALYEVPARWMRERREVADYPASLAHLADDAGFVTAAGRYRGREANGPRDGNQFTHAVVSPDPGSYGLLRPAQLWDAPWWVDSPAPTTECPPVAAPPECGPWTTDAVRDHVRDARDGAERLTALVSAVAALGGEDRRRILLVARDGAEAACWLAAATLLLDVRHALRVSFKIFTVDPDRSPHDVVVVHTDLVDRRPDGYRVFDLVTGELPSVPVVPEAGFWVPRFLAGDAFDVVDAVELAAALDGSAPRPSGGVARDLAALVTGLVDRLEPEVARASARWLADAGPAVADLVGPESVAALAAAGGDVATVRSVDAVTAERAAGDPGWSPRAAGVRERLFDLEVDRAASRGAVDFAGRLSPLPLAAPDVASRLAVLEGLAARTDPTTAVALADRHGLDLTPALAERVASWLADHPATAVDPRGWSPATAGTVLERLYQELDRRLGDARAAATRTAVGDLWWRWPGDPWRHLPLTGSAGSRGVGRIDVEVARAAFRHGGEPRPRALAALATAVAASGERAPWVTVWHAVLGSEPCPSGDVRRFLDAVPRTARDAALARTAYASLIHADADADADHALDLLEEAGLPSEAVGITGWPPPDPGIADVVDRVATADLRGARGLGEALRATTRPARSERDELVAALLVVPPTVAGLVVLHAGATRFRARFLVPDLQACADGTPTRPPDPRALAVLFVFALRSFADGSAEAERRLAALAAAREAVGPEGRKRVLERLGELPLDGVAEHWRSWDERTDEASRPAGVGRALGNLLRGRRRS